MGMPAVPEGGNPVLCLHTRCVHVQRPACWGVPLTHRHALPQVPVYMPDTSMDLASLLKQLSAFGMGGWWLGGTHMVPNMNFIAEVQVRHNADGWSHGHVRVGPVALNVSFTLDPARICC